MSKATVKQFTKYIPKLIKEQLDLDIDYPRIDNLYIILDLIYSRAFYFKTRAQREYSFAQIHKKVFQKFLGKAEHVVADIEYLVDRGFIIRNNYHNWLEGICKGYKIASEFLGIKKEVIITNKKINMKIQANKAEQRKRYVKNLSFQKSRYYKTFKIDHEAAMDYVKKHIKTEIMALCKKLSVKMSEAGIYDIINCTGWFPEYKRTISTHDTSKELINILHRFCVYTSQIENIKEGNLYFKRNLTNGRLDTNLTSLPSFLRPFIISDTQLYSIDFKNSQPYFLYNAIKDEPTIEQNELRLYRDLVISGETNQGVGLYEFLQSKYEELNDRPTTRLKIKNMIMRIFYSKNTSYMKEKDFFSLYFPTINLWMNNIKAKEHNALANLLTNLESNLILDILMVKLKEQDIVPYTIHDSFICSENEVESIVANIKFNTMKLFGCMPNLHINCISVDTSVNEISDTEQCFGLDEDDNWFGVDDEDYKIAA